MGVYWLFNLVNKTELNEKTKAKNVMLYSKQHATMILKDFILCYNVDCRQYLQYFK